MPRSDEITDEDWANEVRILEQERRKRFRKKCLDWIRSEFHRTGELPSWSRVHAVLKLSRATAFRYRSRVMAELEEKQ